MFILARTQQSAAIVRCLRLRPFLSFHMRLHTMRCLGLSGISVAFLRCHSLMKMDVEENRNDGIVRSLGKRAGRVHEKNLDYVPRACRY